MRRIGLPLTLVVATLSLSACLDDPAVRAKLGVDENGSPLPSPTPSGAVVASPAAVVSPSPVPSASISPAPSTSPSPSPQPGVTGHYVETFDPLDLAIAGPGYFVVATRPDPQGMADLRFTRLGRFDLQFTPTGSPAPGNAPAVNNGTWTLKTGEGLTVLGFSYQGPDGTPAPPEARSDYYQGAFTLGGGGSALVTAGPLIVDASANLNFAPGFNFKGQLLSQNKPPVDADGNPRQLFVAVAQFDHPEKLEPQQGFPGFKWNTDVGNIYVGIAGIVSPRASVPRPVGDANLIRTGTLEQ